MLVAQREAEKNRLDELLVEDKKNVIMPGDLFSRIQELLPYQEQGDTQEPLQADSCLFCFNNIEPYRSEVVTFRRSSRNVVVI